MNGNRTKTNPSKKWTIEPVLKYLKEQKRFWFLMGHFITNISNEKYGEWTNCMQKRVHWTYGPCPGNPLLFQKREKEEGIVKGMASNLKDYRRPRFISRVVVGSDSPLIYVIRQKQWADDPLTFDTHITQHFHFLDILLPFFNYLNKE